MRVMICLLATFALVLCTSGEARDLQRSWKAPPSLAPIGVRGY